MNVCPDFREFLINSRSPFYRILIMFLQQLYKVIRKKNNKPFIDGPATKKRGCPTVVLTEDVKERRRLEKKKSNDYRRILNVGTLSCGSSHEIRGSAVKHHGRYPMMTVVTLPPSANDARAFDDVDSGAGRGSIDICTHSLRMSPTIGRPT
ncbi:hypothetical protein POM88_038271 [Heracleum sosnowskyi]|uniref:Uncharacterized protein n=1 Tax=Heracleum sosnowskyi TaxID=360622 RepID=A0AAD8HT04_9APIA|nr:hypothetical protein POM88_038271 [Heracleum sosnowskyi]